MKLIAAAAADWGIGLKNNLLVRIPEDQRFFRRETLGKTVIMGRKTLESLPGGRPLKDRTNIVLSRNKSFRCEGALKYSSVEACLKGLEGIPSDSVYVIGGEQIYRAFLPYCDTALITRIDRKMEADAFFPDLDASSEWVLEEKSGEETYFDLVYHFMKYVRR